jgi:hypothetical protein
VDLRLAEHLDPDNTLSHMGEKQLTTVVSEALRIAERIPIESTRKIFRCCAIFRLLAESL